jgi:hypothetical protein
MSCAYIHDRCPNHKLRSVFISSSGEDEDLVEGRETSSRRSSRSLRLGLPQIPAWEFSSCHRHVPACRRMEIAAAQPGAVDRGLAQRPDESETCEISESLSTSSARRGLRASLPEGPIVCQSASAASTLQPRPSSVIVHVAELCGAQFRAAVSDEALL